jgi:hypothetical protein
MPTRKQRRREQKARRHDWEYVYVDDTGREVEVDPKELRSAKEERMQKRERPSQREKAAASGRAGRTVQPPSWRRVGKRALMIGPVVIVAMFLLNRNLSVGQRIVPAVVMLAFFLPFSYFTDSVAYRMYRKRVERTTGESRS